MGGDMCLLIGGVKRCGLDDGGTGVCMCATTSTCTYSWCKVSWYTGGEGVPTLLPFPAVIALACKESSACLQNGCCVYRGY